MFSDVVVDFRRIISERDVIQFSVMAEVVPMCKVPGKVRGHAVLFAVAEFLVYFPNVF